MARLITTLAVSAALVASGCKSDEPTPPRDTGTPPMMWLVGTGGTMLRVAGDEISGYPLGLGADLRAIDCRGVTDAFAVGESGMVLSTFDGGLEWDHLALGPDLDLRSIAAAHQDVVWAVGGSAVFFSEDSGRTWEEVPEVEESLTAVATTDDGLTAFATSTTGAILRFELRRGFEVVRLPDGRALHAISASPLGESVIAVGAEGIATRSDDYGFEFDDVASDTSMRLRAVRLRSDGEAAIAVGDGGVVVRWGFGPVPDVASAPTDGRSLAALHASASGVVVAVGDDGALVESWDFGATFSSRDVGTDADLTGIDDLHVGAHF